MVLYRSLFGELINTNEPVGAGSAS